MKFLNLKLSAIALPQAGAAGGIFRLLNVHTGIYTYIYIHIDIYIYVYIHLYTHIF